MDGLVPLRAAVQRRPRKPGPWSLAARSRKEGSSPRRHRDIPGGVSKDEARQGCKREVSAQGGDEHLPTCSEPDTITPTTTVPGNLSPPVPGPH